MGKFQSLVICIEAIIYLLSYNSHDCTVNDFVPKKIVLMWGMQNSLAPCNAN